MEIGASALDDDGAMLDFDYREVRVAKAIMKNALLFYVVHRGRTAKSGQSSPDV